MKRTLITILALLSIAYLSIDGFTHYGWSALWIVPVEIGLVWAFFTVIDWLFK